MVPNDTVLTEREAAERLKVTPRTLFRWRSEGKGPDYSRLPSGAIRYTLVAIDTFLKTYLVTTRE